MASSEYFRRQAEVCAKLAIVSSQPEVTDRLTQKALDLQNKAVQASGASRDLEAASADPPPEISRHRLSRSTKTLSA